MPKEIVVEAELEPQQYLSLRRARVNHDVIWSMHVYRTHKPNLIRKLSEGAGGMIKLTDCINVRQKLYP